MLAELMPVACWALVPFTFPAAWASPAPRARGVWSTSVPSPGLHTPVLNVKTLDKFAPSPASFGHGLPSPRRPLEMTTPTTATPNSPRRSPPTIGVFSGCFVYDPRTHSHSRPGLVTFSC
ncbi:hypothetical protein TOT_010000570 [Theileria orientalis strain Shintoku]|uniref:Secreted protein n=1 Tax=Theileria orientalis strain Shintoku TaxID=869250 RepID=J4C7I7_THEOR|nr:hypothetical protein TOT_010000570 [Theileria orientalis strain Shintoku]BAM39108.1 hypothetical protein TOT_010000570 [Theileria orientalis strain Shintoku]|eukprot:XP_009689409.1 hypothetical protein TOT_010000570 [Theileria orientalis strain Shintoku]